MTSDEHASIVSELAADVQSKELVGFDLALGPVKLSNADDVAFVLNAYREAEQAGTDARLVRRGETVALWQRVSWFW